MTSRAELEQRLAADQWDFYSAQGWLYRHHGDLVARLASTRFRDKWDAERKMSELIAWDIARAETARDVEITLGYWVAS